MLKALYLLIAISTVVAQEEEFSREDDFAHLPSILTARFPLLSALLDRGVGASHSSYYPAYAPVPIYVPMPVPESYGWWDKFFPCKHKKDKHKKPFKKGGEEESEDQGEPEHEEPPEHPGYPGYPPYYPQYPPYPLPPPPPYYPPTTTTTEKTTTTAKTTTTTTEAPTTTTTTTTKKPHPVTESHYPHPYPHPPPDYYPHPPPDYSHPPPDYYPHPPDYHKPGYHPPYYPPTTTTTTTTTTTEKPKPTKPLWWTIIFSTPKPATKKTDTKRKLDQPQPPVVVTNSDEIEDKNNEPIQDRPPMEYDEDYAGPTEKLEPEDPWAIPV